MICPDEEYCGPERRTRCEHAEDAAEKAVRKTFAILGVDIDSPREVSEFQQSLRFGDKLRKTADKGIIAFVVSVAGIMGTAVYIGVKTKITGSP